MITVSIILFASYLHQRQHYFDFVGVYIKWPRGTIHVLCGKKTCRQTPVTSRERILCNSANVMRHRVLEVVNVTYILQYRSGIMWDSFPLHHSLDHVHLPNFLHRRLRSSIFSLLSSIQERCCLSVNSQNWVDTLTSFISQQLVGGITPRR